jgi:phosphatidylinositol alpha-mannosyltransferase
MKPRLAKRIKIGLVCPYNLFRGGGVQEHVLAVQEELQKRGHTVKIITPQPRGHDGIVEDHIVLVGGSTDFKSLFHTTAQVSASIDVDAMEDMLGREKFDILHFHEPWVPLLSRQLLMRSSAVNIATFHAKLPETVVSRTIEKVITPYTKSVLKYLDAFSAVSDAAAEYVNEIAPDAEVNIIPNGIDTKKYRAPKPKSGGESILYIGRLEKRKGVRYLLEAFAELYARRPGVSLQIAGEGPERESLEQFVDTNGLKGVHFHGRVTDEKKLKLLEGAALFCSPALYGESFGIVLLEAMSMGVVIVAGDNQGYSTVLTGTGRLSLVNPKDTVDFARRLELLIDDDQLRALWRKWAAEQIKQYDYTRIVDRYESLYRSVLKKGK